MGALIHLVKLKEIGQHLSFPEDLLESLSGKYKGSSGSLQRALPASSEVAHFIVKMPGKQKSHRSELFNFPAGGSFQTGIYSQRTISQNKLRFHILTPSPHTHARTLYYTKKSENISLYPSSMQIHRIMIQAPGLET